jgi:biopolymer transport protein ExbB
MDFSVFDLFGQGGYVIWVVLGFSVIAVAVAIERALAQWNFMTRARQLGEIVTRGLTRGAVEESRSACERSPSPMADVFLVGYERLKTSKPEHVVTAVHRERLRVNQQLRRWLWVLGTVGATAPFVGLVGTVVGIISGLGRFHKGQQVGFSDVAGPVSEALVVTAAGIGVAVVAVILFNYFSQRASQIATEMRLLTDEFLELLLDVPQDSEPKRRKPETDAEVEAKVKAEKGDKSGAREAA